MGDQHERAILTEFKTSTPALVEIMRDEPAAVESTLEAIKTGAPIIFQAALHDGPFAGFTHSLSLRSSRK